MRDESVHLSRISTEWDLVFQAHNGPPDVVSSAQTKLMARYAGAVHRYLLGAVRDPDLAADLDQEFALRFLRGDFHRADPSRGRFRDFIKRALRNLMVDHHRKRRRVEVPIGEGGVPEPPDPDGGLPDFDRQFTESWKRELMAQAWASLARHQEQTGQPLHTVLQHRMKHPEEKSPGLASLLTRAMGKPVSAGWVRENLSRARDLYVGALVDGVRASLEIPTRGSIQEELADLGLLEYCRPSLRRRGLSD
ncbi:RNA polymerase sigma factor [Tautonia plasticadhaerens]|uniref:RNA polymerase sigma factor n=1 Tax=Tautonia plasticadhaerens TaxID=2527974 RepID=A0A518H7I8_9BACT|nr:sigma-70 family RNA polymerase sigma factor [Tautonia plasticadhaerens]QDV36827.1 RNA polymerase sigma factor [Tautonia plasticadhaerens]